MKFGPNLSIQCNWTFMAYILFFIVFLWLILFSYFIDCYSILFIHYFYDYILNYLIFSSYYLISLSSSFFCNIYLIFIFYCDFLLLCLIFLLFFALTSLLIFSPKIFLSLYVSFLFLLPTPFDLFPSLSEITSWFSRPNVVLSPWSIHRLSSATG